MLEPQSRAALTEQLRPPSGFELAHAVGTTFTLDLSTALSIPLSFAAHRIADTDDPIGVLDAVRRAADKIDVFAQAGEISMGVRSDLIAFLEPMVHPVTVGRGLFHPKVWLLEYRSVDEVQYRFLCASRNLTTDRSWDVLVRLDGYPAAAQHAEHAASVSPPLRAFVENLPALALHALDDLRRDRILDLAARTRSIAWETPDDMRDLAFHPQGVPGSALPDFTGKRALIISPFLSGEGIATLRQRIRTDTHLISRAESLDRLDPASLDRRLSTYLLDDAATQLGDDDSESERAWVPPGERLVGLHAKVVVVDRLDGAHVFMGSANATGAAWASNVEFMVELVGPIPRFGVEATLAALGELKEEYSTEGGLRPDADEEAERRLESHLRRLSGVPLWARVMPDDPFALRVWAGERFADLRERATRDGLSVSWHLLTRPDLGSSSLGVGEQDAEEVGGLPLTDITPFIVLVVRDAEGRERSGIQLALLLDDVASRRDAIVARQLTDRASFIRLLTLLLEISGLGSLGAIGSGAAGFFGESGGGTGAGLFEALMRAVGDGGAGLSDARRIVEFVREQGDEREILPPGFDELWQQVWAAHLHLRGAV